MNVNFWSFYSTSLGTIFLWLKVLLILVNAPDEEGSDTQTAGCFSALNVETKGFTSMRVIVFEFDQQTTQDHF